MNVARLVGCLPETIVADVTATATRIAGQVTGDAAKLEDLIQKMSKHATAVASEVTNTAKGAEGHTGLHSTNAGRALNALVQTGHDAVREAQKSVDTITKTVQDSVGGIS